MIENDGPVKSRHPGGPKVVTPAKAGVQFFCSHLICLDTGFRRYDVNQAGKELRE